MLVDCVEVGLVDVFGNYMGDCVLIFWFGVEVGFLVLECVVVIGDW